MWTDSEHLSSMHLPIVKPGELPVEAAELRQELESELGGEVRFDAGSRALYAADAGNYRQVPIGVVVPRSAADVIAAIAICHRHGVPVLPRGAGTSIPGQCCNVAIVLDFSKYLNRILSIDADRRLAAVEPGCVLDDLRHEAQRKCGLTFGPDPSTHKYCTLGGMIGNDSCGVHAQTAGRTSANVESLDVLTHDGVRLRVGRTSDEELQQIIAAGGRRGEIYRGLRDLRDRYGPLIRERFPKLARRVSGINNLDQLLPENGFNVARALTGTEGTCVTILEASLNLIHFCPFSCLVVLGYSDIYEAASQAPLVNTFTPFGLEGFDELLKEDIKKKNLHPEFLSLLPEGKGWLIVQFWGDTKDEADAQARRLIDHLRDQRTAPTIRFLDDPKQMDHLWKLRESGLGATARTPGKPDAWEGWEDSAVPPEQLASYLRSLRALYEKHGYEGAFYGHFGQGCVHTRITFDLLSEAGIRKWRAFLDEAADLIVSLGGSLSGEHGDGQARGELLGKMYGDELVEAFREFKRIWDPDGLMNPGKLVDARPITENLRFGADYSPARVQTHFQFPDDDGEFYRATERCVGVGKCRQKEGGTMCPSYRVTREESDSTRGRAHALFEMLQGDVIKDGWRDEHVKDTLDLCLACKGCKGECPMQVDMATYKSEFLSHYYEGRLRPRSAYAFGLIHWWARAASMVPRLANLVTHLPGLSRIAKLLAGMSQEREIPTFALRTFKDWFFAREAPRTDGPRVLLWPDTFNNHFHPEVAQAAVEVLEAAGCQVEVPRAALCCGRPLYDYGMLQLAQHQLRRIMRELREDIVEGTPIVGLEPSCVAVFRDELINLFPDDPLARKLSQQTFLLSEYLEKKRPDWSPPALERRAIVQGHCHHKAIMKVGDEASVLRKMKLDYEVLDAGCCGMAGSFGFESRHYALSIGCGERKLLPAVRAAGTNTLVLADGFSCREQIRQQTKRRGLHLAQALQMALREGPRGARRAPPERRYVPSRRRIVRQSFIGVALPALLIGAAALVLGRPWLLSAAHRR